MIGLKKRRDNIYGKMAFCAKIRCNGMNTGGIDTGGYLLCSSESIWRSEKVYAL